MAATGASLKESNQMIIQNLLMKLEGKDSDNKKMEVEIEILIEMVREEKQKVFFLKKSEADKDIEYRQIWVQLEERVNQQNEDAIDASDHKPFGNEFKTTTMEVGISQKEDFVSGEPWETVPYLVKIEKSKLNQKDNIKVAVNENPIEYKCKFCHLEVEAQDLNHSMKKCLKELLKRLKCSHCSVEAVTKDHLVGHLKSEHGVTSPPYPCLKPDCVNVLNTKYSLSKHMRLKHGFRLKKKSYKKEWKFSCNLCFVPNFFSSEEECKKHELFWHKYSCNLCDFTSESEKKRLKHNAKKHEQPNDNAKKHEQPIAIAKVICCELCGKIFANSNNLKDHKELHENKELFCDKCNKVFKRTLNLKMHQKHIHSNKTFVCQDCGKECRSSRHLRWHIAQNHKAKKFNCMLCPKGFLDNKKLAIHHISVHTKDLPFKCKHGCDKTYSDRSNCRQHERSIHEGKQRNYERKHNIGDNN